VKEANTTNEIMRFFKALPNCYAFKEHGGLYGTAGLPDLICCYHGMFVAFEVKTPTGKLSKLQEITIQKIKDAQGQAFTVRSVREVKEALDRIIV
jgi:hypothetical protein